MRCIDNTPISTFRSGGLADPLLPQFGGPRSRAESLPKAKQTLSWDQTIQILHLMTKSSSFDQDGILLTFHLPEIELLQCTLHEVANVLYMRLPRNFSWERMQWCKQLWALISYELWAVMGTHYTSAPQSELATGLLPVQFKVLI